MSGGGKGGGRTRKGTVAPVPAEGNGSVATPDARPDPCNLRFLTSLASVDPIAALTVTVGAELPVRLERRRDIDIVAVATADDAQVLGAINAPETVQLVECIRAGRRYAASVRNADGAAIAVHVHPA